jgi:transcriptional regulator with XRE-family HTH domain
VTESVRAVRATVQIGSLTVDGFMLPDGSYRMSQTQVAEAVGLSRRNVSDFLRSNALKSLLGEGYTDSIFEREEIEIESEPGSRGQSRFLSVPPEIASAYWLWQAHRGNKVALVLCMGLITESLERRFDEAFGVTRTELERNELLSQRVQELEQDIREAFWVEDEIRIQRDHYQWLLREYGIDPWGIPGADEE